MRRHSIPDRLIKAVIVAKEQVGAAEATIVLAGNWRTSDTLAVRSDSSITMENRRT